MYLDYYRVCSILRIRILVAFYSISSDLFRICLCPNGTVDLCVHYSGAVEIAHLWPACGERQRGRESQYLTALVPY